jgi:hypothetical protein
VAYIPDNGNLQTTCLKLFDCVEDKDKTEAQASYKGISNLNIRNEEGTWKV